MSTKLLTNPEIIEKYLSDESNSFHASINSIDGVYLPSGKKETKEIIISVNNSKKQCTTSGGGTGITGSRVPNPNEVIIATDNITKAQKKEGFEEINYNFAGKEYRIYFNKSKMQAFVPSGISIELLQKILPNGYFYPPDPTETTAFIGGTIATNASGAKSYYYGATRKWVEGLELVLANGDTLFVKRGDFFCNNKREFTLKSESEREYKLTIPFFNSPKIKNAAGIHTAPQMDLIDLFIGSEGIFGIITGALIKLEKKKETMGCIIFFSHEKDALSFADDLRNSDSVFSIEYFDSNALEFIKKENKNLKDNFQYAIYTEIDGSNDNTLEALDSSAQKNNSVEDWFGDTPLEMEKLKKFRHSLPEGINRYLKQHQSSKLGTDFVVPKENFPELMNFYKKTGEKFKKTFPQKDIHYALFGHLGSYHLHFNFITTTKEEMSFAKTLYAQMAEKVIELNGTISGEHGVGKKKITINGKEYPYLKLMYGNKGLYEIGAMKKVFDPNLILNTNNIISKEYLR